MIAEPTTFTADVETRVRHDPSHRNVSSTSSQSNASSSRSHHTAPRGRSQISRDATIELERDRSEHASTPAFIITDKRGNLPTKSSFSQFARQDQDLEHIDLISDSQPRKSDVNEQPLHRTHQTLDSSSTNGLQQVNQHNTRVNPRKRSYPDYVSSGPENEDLDPPDDSDEQSQKAPPPSQPLMSSLKSKRRGDISDNPRLDWDPDLLPLHGTYVPQLAGKWWTRSSTDVHNMRDDRRARISHVGRIMETVLGEQLSGDNRCAQCIKCDDECWVYSSQIRQTRLGANLGPSCARCRKTAHSCVRPDP